MRRALAALLAAVIAGCASSAGPPPAPMAGAAPSASDAGPATPAPIPDASSPDAPPDRKDARETKRIARMMKRVAKARGLEPTKAVPGVVLPRDALLDRVRKHVEKEVPPEVIRDEGEELKLLGFIPVAFDFLATTYELLNAQLAGYYEPTDGTMYMAGDLDEPNADATLAHELDHALQDQHFDLAAHSKYVPGKSDEQAAYDALAEGDATSTMMDVLMGQAMGGKTALDVPDDLLETQMLEAIGAGSMKVPPLMRTSLAAPYIYGTVFVNALRRAGGWPAVDAAWRALPTTSEQILHVEKWRAHEPALAVPAPSFAALGSGWTVADEDSSGELGMRLAFEEWIGGPKAVTAAAGWGGDRDVLVTNGDVRALAIHVRYDATRTQASSSDPFALLAPGLAKTVGKPQVKEAAWLCIARAELGPLGVMKKGQELVFVAGPSKTGDKAWSSAGDCALAKRWATEIAAQ
jgi:hypothetical protein